MDETIQGNQVVQEQHPLRNNAVALVLVGITLVAWLVFDMETHHTLPVNIASAFLLILALLKAKLILNNFMELRSAPRHLRWVFDGWMIVIGVVMMVFVL